MPQSELTAIDVATVFRMHAKGKSVLQAGISVVTAKPGCPDESIPVHLHTLV
jgi:hypothetical protein